jgi:hypothetical protein
MIVPKTETTLRIVSQLDPLDALIFTALIHEVSPAIEKSRVPSSRSIACSYRVSIDENGSLFAHNDGWPEFQAKSRALAFSHECEYVLVVDITDFYNQASQHRIENSLETSGIPTDQAKVIEHFLSELAAKHSRGLPVGPSASIVLAEACLNDVDTYLIRLGIPHVRYVDDFRIFCPSYRCALEMLHSLTDYLHTSHRLTLNSSKTKIYNAVDFVESQLSDPEADDVKRRTDKKLVIDEFLKLFKDAGEGYASADENESEDTEDNEDESSVDINDLSITQSALQELFDEAISDPAGKQPMLRYILRRAASLRTTSIHSRVVQNLSKLAPLFRDVAKYFAKTKKATQEHIASLLDFLDTDNHGKLPYVRIWMFNLFEELQLVDDYPYECLRKSIDSVQFVSTRSSALIARKAGVLDWIRERKENWSTFGAWDRRAIIYAGSALPRDERNPWLGLVIDRGDSVDRAVAEYSKTISS